MAVRNGKQQINYWLDDDLVKAIDRHWHQKALTSRAEAIRDLISTGLAVSKKDPSPPPKPAT